jgi:DNA-binding XRE family transcriptional regulator
MKRTPGYVVRGDRIRALRQRRFMRQEDLAKLANLTPSSSHE